MRQERTPLSAYDRALSLLAVREHTEQEIRQKLRQKEYPQDQIDDAVERLLKEHAISEERFVEVFVRSRMRKSPEGKYILSQRLSEKGSPKNIYRPYLEEYWENEEWLPYLSLAVESGVRKKGREKALAAFARKGWSWSELNRALANIDEDEADMEDIDDGSDFDFDD